VRVAATASRSVDQQVVIAQKVLLSGWGEGWGRLSSPPCNYAKHALSLELPIDPIEQGVDDRFGVQ
jgi:hypothetical protein